MSRSEPGNGPTHPTPRETHSRDRPNLQVTLGIDVSASHECPVAGAPDTWNGTVQLVGSTCHLSLAPEEDSAERTRTVTSRVTDRCLCSRLCGDGFTPVDLAVEQGSLVIGGYVSDRETLSELTDRLEDTADRWRLRRLTATVRDDDAPDTSGDHESIHLTEKQRETVETAVDMGYYDRPREASLGDLADRLGVTRSALSQRLNAVESKLIHDLSETL
ncbi:MAG: helix-turn-helix domain-containing protein [Halanaeroarchaeum sp.]